MVDEDTTLAMSGGGRETGHLGSETKKTGYNKRKDSPVRSSNVQVSWKLLGPDLGLVSDHSSCLTPGVSRRFTLRKGLTGWIWRGTKGQEGKPEHTVFQEFAKSAVVLDAEFTTQPQEGGHKVPGRPVSLRVRRG